MTTANYVNDDENFEARRERQLKKPRPPRVEIVIPLDLNVRFGKAHRQPTGKRKNIRPKKDRFKL